MNTETVTVMVPAAAGHLALLRTVVGGYAARDNFTLDQVDDLRMAVEEAAVQLLRQIAGDHLTLEVTSTEAGMELRLHGEVTGETPVIDEGSFSWTILRALADDLAVEAQQDQATIVLTKLRVVARERG